MKKDFAVSCVKKGLYELQARNRIGQDETRDVTYLLAEPVLFFSRVCLDCFAWERGIGFISRRCFTRIDIMLFLFVYFFSVRLPE